MFIKIKDNSVQMKIDMTNSLSYLSGSHVIGFIRATFNMYWRFIEDTVVNKYENATVDVDPHLDKYRPFNIIHLIKRTYHTHVVLMFG